MLKLMFKEDFTAPGANKVLLFPGASAHCGDSDVALCGHPVLQPTYYPRGDYPVWPQLDLTVAALNQGVNRRYNVGLLSHLRSRFLAVYGAVLGGWASYNKYSLLGRCASAPRWSAMSWPWASRSSAS